MSQVSELGTLNGHLIGVVCKEAVRRAMVAITNQRLAFEVNPKQGYGGEMNDVCTSADKAAQDVYVNILKEAFPDISIIAEENNLQIYNKFGTNAFFTVDPLDGTKAFTRRQSHGIGTMISLSFNNEIICAYVGDVCTGEIYGFRPDSNKVYRITNFDIVEELPNSLVIEPKKGYALLRDPLPKYSDFTNTFITNTFESHQVEGGSIGTWLARLWKREVVAAVMTPNWTTPWDMNPIVGISKKLGYKFFRPGFGNVGQDNEKIWVEVKTAPIIQKYSEVADLLVIHENDVRGMIRLGVKFQTCG